MIPGNQPHPERPIVLPLVAAAVAVAVAADRRYMMEGPKRRQTG